MAMHQIEPIRPITDTIPEYFSGKSVFITGFTGFLGQFLVQKLLTECPDIGDIYVLIRQSRGKTGKERVEQSLQNPIFDHLRNGNLLTKIHIVEGDLMLSKLGLSDDNRKILIENVSIVYHVAATVRFDMPLSDAIILNVRGTADVCELAQEMKHIKTFMHVSTAYCQLHGENVYEQLYPPPADWRQVIEIAENFDSHQLSVLCSKYSEGYPNTYTFTKALAESVVSDMCTFHIPTVIFRPTIVTSAYKGVLPGWTANFNGPIGLMAAQSKGVVRCAYAAKDSSFDMIPIDYMINMLIKSVWLQQYLRNDEVSVYNCSSYGNVHVDMERLQNLGQELVLSETFDPVWSVNMSYTTSTLVYYLNILLFHFLPGLLVDFVLQSLGRRPMFVKVQRRVYIASLAVAYFMSNQWNFRNEKCESLDDHLQESDKKAFLLPLVDSDLPDYLRTGAVYIQKHLLKENLNDVDKFKRKQTILWYVHNFIKYATLIILLKFVSNRVLVPLLDSAVLYWDNLLWFVHNSIRYTTLAVLLKILCNTVFLPLLDNLCVYWDSL